MATNNKHLILDIQGPDAPLPGVLLPMNGLITYGSSSSGSGAGSIQQVFFYKNGKKFELIFASTPYWRRIIIKRAIIKLLASDDMTHTLKVGLSSGVILVGWSTI